MEGNVAYGLEQARPRIDSREISRRVGEALEMVHLGSYRKRKIHELSGGQQQRVALARALINKPRVLLLDEPLAALDKKLRTAMQLELQNLHRDLGITFLLVTHDQEEALSMSDQVCVMNAGRIVQLASPEEIYDQARRPLRRGLRRQDQQAQRPGADHGWPVRYRAARQWRKAAHSQERGHPHRRGDAVRAARDHHAWRQRARARTVSPGAVTHRIFLGSSAEYVVDVPGLGDILVSTGGDTGEAHFDIGGEVSMSIDPAAPHVFAEAMNTGRGKHT